MGYCGSDGSGNLIAAYTWNDNYPIIIDLKWVLIPHGRDHQKSHVFSLEAGAEQIDKNGNRLE